MKDQCDNPVPEDLVILPRITELVVTQIEAIDKLDWYRDGHLILVSRKSLEAAIGADTELFDDYIPLTGVQYINHNLHRYSDEDGWYVA